MTVSELANKLFELLCPSGAQAGMCILARATTIRCVQEHSIPVFANEAQGRQVK